MDKQPTIGDLVLAKSGHSPVRRPRFLDRAENPRKYPFISNDGASVSTHLMAAEIDPQTGKSYAFPTIVLTDEGRLKQFDNAWEALEYNKKIGNAVEFDSIEEAIEFSKGQYKTQELKDYASLLSGYFPDPLASKLLNAK